MKITFITGHLCKERHALLYELALDLGENGAEVTVITGYPSRRISEEVKNYYLEHPVEKVSDNVTVVRVGSKKGEGDGLFVRMLKYIALTKRLYNEAKRIPSDAYYIYSSPPFLGWMGTKLVRKAPTLYNAQDIFPDTLIRIKGINENNPFIRYLRKKETKAYNGNTRIVTISEDMRKTISARTDNPEKIDVVNNWADVDNLHHVTKEQNKLMDNLGINKDRFTVSYAGDIGLFQGWDIILNAIKILNDKNDNIDFVFIGSGSYKDEMQKRIANEKIENTYVYPLQSREWLSEVYSVGDVELVPIEQGITKIALPSKLGVILATGTPVLALVDMGSNVEHIINYEKLGVAIEHGDAARIADTIQELYENRGMLGLYGENARRYAVENHNRKKQTKEYFRIIEKMAKETEI